MAEQLRNVTPPNEQPQGGNFSRQQQDEGTVLPLVVYILYLLGFFAIVPAIGYFAPLPMIVGVVIAYVCKGDAPEWLAEHYRFQIRTFWIYLFYAFMVLLLAFTVILLPFALLLGGLMSIWIIVRCVRGLVMLQKRNAPQNPDVWLY